MFYSQAVDLLNESGLTPEAIAERIAVSNSTYRRWQKASPSKTLPESYRSNVSVGVYKLLGEGLLTHDSKRVTGFMLDNLPDFFQAAISGLHVSTETFTHDSPHQDKITSVLSQLGNSSHVRKRVDKSHVVIKKFCLWGDAWKERIGLLSGVIKNNKFSLVDKLIAYGALFYLILPFDLIPDSIPVFGYVDDFGILGFASAYYTKKMARLSP